MQNVCTGFVYGRYAKEIDCLSLGWRPLNKKGDQHLLNITFKALYFEQWPTYHKLRKDVPGITLRSSNYVKLEMPLVNGPYKLVLLMFLTICLQILEIVTNLIFLDGK